MLGLERYRTHGFNRDLDSLLSQFFEDQSLSDIAQRTKTPLTDIYETEDHVKIHLDLPGMTRENLDIQVTENNTLTVRGERKFEEVDKAKYHRVERFYGAFSRSFVMPSNVEADKITATFKDGVLEILLPKAESAKARKISIKS